MKRYLAIDLGASGGRGIVGEYENGRLALREVHRFESVPAALADGLHWDVADLFRHVKLAMEKTAKLYGADGVDGMAIDSWGVDYGLVDQNGALLHLPFHYRDTRTEKYLGAIDAIVPRRELFGINGLQYMNFNTVCQLYAHFHDSPYLASCADTFLMIPQLLSFFLTGKKCAEYTDASTTGLVNARTRDWDAELCGRLGIPARIFPPIVMPGTVLGAVREEIARETGLAATVINAASHDTASAVAALPHTERESVYISSGTWSLMGVLTDEPIITDESFAVNFTNEGSPERKIRFLKNIAGMWPIQQARRVWNAAGKDKSYADIAREAQEAEGFEAFIDPDDPAFGVICDMPEAVRRYCAAHGEPVPDTDGKVARVIYESLALKYRENLERLERITGKTYGVIQIVGGGSANELMCRFAANACGRTVTAGPTEATAAGNVVMQLISSGAVSGVEEASRVIARSFDCRVFEPSDTAAWDEKYARYTSVVSR